MAGSRFQGNTFVFDGTTVPHMTAWDVTPSSSSITQVVADSAAPLTVSESATTSASVTFVAKNSGLTAVLSALAQGNQGQLVITIIDGIGGTTISTWTSADSLCESQGAVVTGSAGGFVTVSCGFTTNGGSWA